MSRTEMMFSCWKWRRILISRNVRRQNMEWSKGVMRLIATLRFVSMWIALQTSPYAPSPIQPVARRERPAQRYLLHIPTNHFPQLIFSPNLERLHRGGCRIGRVGAVESQGCHKLSGGRAKLRRTYHVLSVFHPCLVICAEDLRQRNHAQDTAKEELYTSQSYI